VSFLIDSGPHAASNNAADSATTTRRPLKGASPLRGVIVSQSTFELLHQGNNRWNQGGNQYQDPIKKCTERIKHRSPLGDDSATP